MMRTLNRIRRVHFRPVDLLAQAAKSLTSIQEIRWSGGARAICPPLDFTNTLQTAFAAVAACCSIRSLKVHDVGRPLPCLTAFSEIEDIAVYGAMPKESLLALLPGSRPTPLRSITFAARTFDGSKSTQVSVTDLFVNAKATLQSLNLAAVVFPLQSVSLITPLIANLTHLCFSSMSIPDAFWTHLQQDRIHCTTLHVRNVGVTDTLLQYIASYTGLLDLMIISSISYDEPETIGHLPPELGLRFWVDVLPCHTTTLSSLAVADQIVDSSWCLSDEGLEKLAQCRRLRELHVSPHDTHILRSSGSANYLKRLPHMLSLAVWPEMHTIWITNPARDRSAPLTREDYKEDFEHFGESRLHHEIYHSRSCIIW